MTRKIIIVNGSPRENGNSVLLAGEVTRGARENGAAVEVFDLAKMKINPCNACDACRSGNNSGCTVKDDMQIIYPEISGAEVIVIASPVYWFSVAAQTKLFIDRFYGLEGNPVKALKGKKIAIILTYEDADPFISGAVNALRMYQDIFRYVGAEIIGMVYGSAGKAGEIIKNKALMEKAYRLGKELAG